MSNQKGFGTAPVFFTAISTILGAILFLRFGYGVGTLGFWGIILIIIVGHLVTIPTALAISELATNKRVEGGGEYFIISRSFGLNIGATIGFSLFLSQAISVAFYVIAFTESFSALFSYAAEQWCITLPRQAVSIPAMGILAALILTKGASMGVKTLYVIVGILAASLVAFFLGSTPFAESTGFNLSDAQFRNADQFFIVFAIIFPAFTGMTAGVGLSGDLRNPSKSIPLGTTAATLVGMLIYFFITWKLASSASSEELMNNQMVMSDIALGGKWIIPIGLAASTISSAIGSILVAPRTLQALASDKAFQSSRINHHLQINDAKGEPKNATIITIIIAFIFVAIGDVNAVAQIISMFFMVTYGALCLISFLNHFGSSPSYRPSFQSKWYFSLIGFITAIYVMFRIDPLYAILAFVAIIGLYFYVQHYHRDRKGFEIIFTNTFFQVNRKLQVFLQNARKRNNFKEWRPSSICISDKSFERKQAFQLQNWLAYRYGFGTYIHFMEGYFSKKTHKEAIEIKDLLLEDFGRVENHVYVDTIISPSFTSAIAQTVQLPGIAGMENNMIIFDNNNADIDSLRRIIDNYSMVNAADFDVLILRTGKHKIHTQNDIHVWLQRTDDFNCNLMILLAFIIGSHPDWKNSKIKIFEVCSTDEINKREQELQELITKGRLPITLKNIHILEEDKNNSFKQMVNKHSEEADLIISGFRGDHLKHEGEKIFEGFECENMLFVNSHSEKIIE
ncbi:MAG: amino acid permease [Mangrovibacterium sp.]